MGHTPVDSAFTVFGLLGAGQVMELLLSMPVLGLVFIIALLGFFFALARAATAGSPLPVFAFLIINLGLFFFFSTLTSLSSNAAVSWAEQHGAEVDPEVEQALADVPADTSTTSVGLVYIVRAMSAIVRGMTELVNEDFIAAPMAVTRAITAGMQFDISDPAIRKRADEFKINCYTPAVQLYVDGLNAGDALTQENLRPERTWPGSPEITALYPRINSGFTTPSGQTVLQSCNTQWEKLIRDLTGPGGEVNRLRKIFETSDTFRDNTDEDYLQLIFSNYFRSAAKRKDTAAQQASAVLGELPRAAITAVTTLFNVVSLGTRATQIAAFGPYVQGAAIGFLLYVFPLLLIAILIPGGGRILTNYFLIILWLRSWTLGWALSDQITGVLASAMWAETDTLTENVTHLFGGLTAVNALLYLLSPLVMFVVIGGGGAALSSLLGFSGIGPALCDLFGTHGCGCYRPRDMMAHNVAP